MKRLHIYCGASSWRDLKTMTLDSLAISLSMVFQPSLLICGCSSPKKAKFLRQLTTDGH